MRVRSLGAVMVVWVLVASSGKARCPSSELIDSTLRQLDLTAAYRTEAFALEPPWALFRKAAAKPGKVIVDRDGKLGQAVVVYELPIEVLWMAINDEDHYAEGGYLPVEHSEVIGGISRGERRILFQFFKRSGFGRWWIDEVIMNRELFEASEGQLWELRWRDLMEDYAEKGLPDEYSSLGLSPIRESRGAWLMVSVGERCTLVEYVTMSNPGGLLNVVQWLASGRVIRENLEGIQRLAAEHLVEPHPEAGFTRPDGTPIEITTVSE